MGPVLALLLAGPVFPRPAPAEEAAEPRAALAVHARDPFRQHERERAIQALAAEGTVAAAAALRPLLADPFEHLHDCVATAWVRMLRLERDAALPAWFVARATADRRATVRAAAVRALARGAPEAFRAALPERLRRERDAAVLTAWTEGALALPADPGLAGRFRPLLRHRAAPVVQAAALAVAHVDGAAAHADLRALLGHRKPLARAGAVEALQRTEGLTEADLARVLADEAAAPRIALAESLAWRTPLLPVPGRGLAVLERLLATPSWRVRAGAVQGALRLWDPAIVPLLIARLAVEDARLLDDVHRALVTYTGHDVGTDADLWQAWWRARRDGFDAGARPATDANGRIRWRAARAEAGASPTVAFFEVPLHSRRVAFVFDLSGSIADAAGDGRRTKLEVMAAAFSKTVAELVPGTVFDLFVYRYPSRFPPEPELTRAFGRLREVGRRSAARAVTWLARQAPGGWGAFYEPLEAVLAEDVDTVFLLSDGGPSRGRLHRVARIVAAFARANRFRYLQVNTVLLGRGATRRQRAFMEALAAATGGRFRWARD